MNMTPLLSVAAVLSALNIGLLATLLVVWGRNYRRFGTPLTLGFVAFAGVLAVENVVAIGFFISSGMLYAADPAAQTTVVAMRALQFVALGFLTSVTLR
ncbi:hypothetical protein [Haloplanus sp.]|uniref:hypothetical protein n=1 Tax=Haloplanus sp. TaxID=1961696 RepID=UPI0026236A09|nr:hypothetical protein [Haloplanus sp.]